MDEDLAYRPDPVVEAYKKGIDRTLIRENLRLTPEERLIKLMRLQEFAEELRRAGKAARRRLLRVLPDAGVEFILVGGAAATAHGSARLTQDIGVVHGRSPEDLRRLADALTPYQPYLRGAPPAG